jgi:hypothetical protein
VAARVSECSSCNCYIHRGETDAFVTYIGT